MLFSGNEALNPRWAMVCGIRREASRRDVMAEAHVAAVSLWTEISRNENENENENDGREM